MRLLFITDFTEQFAYRLLKGILDYARETEPWVVCKMPPSYKKELGIPGVVKWALEWHADVVIGQFDPDDDVTLFKKNGIVALAQDYIVKFDSIPNITADYDRTGAMVAERFLSLGFKNFGFFGYNNVCWSDERCDGFKRKIEEAGYGQVFYKYDRQSIESVWNYNRPGLLEWIQELPRPVAIMACDDNQAIILLQACKAMGVKIPSEIAIVGVDNDEILCNLSDPSLSSVNVNIERGGYEAAKMAERMVKDSSYQGEDIVLKPIMLVRRLSSSVYATKDPAILTALHFISSNIDRHINVGDVLEVVPLSRRLLEQRFLKATGTTIYKFISYQRVSRFAELLLESNDSVANIAARLDEPDTRSISRRFLAIKGCTPTEFRRRELRKLGV
ncbi:MAG: DNA-binding transcriptional regulator [Bacteroidales bacterium]|nr:DNA-binding transcriptional regulator [Bacteroidales bacterium]